MDWGIRAQITEEMAIVIAKNLRFIALPQGVRSVIEILVELFFES
jgi:hypothetical protein